MDVSLLKPLRKLVEPFLEALCKKHRSGQFLGKFTGPPDKIFSECMSILKNALSTRFHIRMPNLSLKAGPNKKNKPIASGKPPLLTKVQGKGKRGKPINTGAKKEAKVKARSNNSRSSSSSRRRRRGNSGCSGFAKSRLCHKMLTSRFA